MPTNIDRLSTWQRYRPSMCRDCGGYCCRLPVEANIADLKRMGYLDAEEGLWSAKKIARKLTALGVVRDFRARTMLFTFAQRPNRDCVFMGADRLCTIYEKRPDVCRKFPDIGPRPGWCPFDRKKMEKALSAQEQRLFKIAVVEKV